MKFRKVVIFCSFLFAASHTAMAQAEGKVFSGTVSSFVQHFYDWYVPFSVKDRKEAAWIEVLTHKPAMLGATLFHALQADMRIQSHSEGEIAGLDFDPFLNAQDPCDRYEVGKATRVGPKYLVEVYGVCSGVKSKKPDIIAELALNGSSWIFENFRYPESHTDLLTLLHRLHM